MFETIGNATLYLGEYEDVLPGLVGVDAIVSDPPYGINNKPLNITRGRNNWVRGADFKPIQNDDKPFNPELLLGFKKVVMFGANHYCSRLPDASCWLVWDKREGGTPDNQSDCEMAWTNLPGPARMFSHLWRGICRRGEENISTGSYKLHPNQKPIALMIWCIEQCRMKPNSLITDTHLGSGTTGIAAIRLGHRFIGIESDPEWFDVACERIYQEQRQLTLGSICVEKTTPQQMEITA